MCVLLPPRTDPKRKRQRQRECTCLAQLSSASNRAQIPRVLLHRVLTKNCTKHDFNKTAPVRDQHKWTGTDFGDFFYRDKPSCPWMREMDRALNSHQVESCDVTSRHIFWANCFRSEIKTPLQQHADYKTDNTVNKCVLRQQFEESLRVFQLSEMLFLLWTVFTI